MGTGKRNRSKIKTSIGAAVVVMSTMLGIPDAAATALTAPASSLQNLHTPAAILESSKKEFGQYMGVSLSGDLQVGQTLTARIWTEPGNPMPAGTELTFKWYRNGKQISDATKTKIVRTADDMNASYKLRDADKGKEVTCKVTLKKANYINRVLQELDSSKNVVVRGRDESKKLAFEYLPIPWATTGGVVGETAQVLEMGIFFGAIAGLPNPADVTFSYQWYRDGKIIPEATKKDYVYKAADIGKDITVAVTYHAQGYQDVTVMNMTAADLENARKEGHTTAVAPRFEKNPGFSKCKYSLDNAKQTWTMECGQTLFVADDDTISKPYYDKTKQCGIFENKKATSEFDKYVYRCTKQMK